MAQATLAAISHGSLDTNDAVVAVVAIMRDDGYQEGEHVEIQHTSGLSATARASRGASVRRAHNGAHHTPRRTWS